MAGPPTRVHTAIVGAGFSGIGAAILLERAGLGDFLIFERSGSVGGTWRDNTYPGAACDVPSALYSFSFAPWAGWSHRYARQVEIRAYLEHCVDHFGVRDRLRTGAELVDATFHAGRWRLRMADGSEVCARFVVFGLGALRDPRWPDLPGLDGFAGPVVHTARWRHGLELRGRVGLIGTGASAIQVGPELAPHASRLTVFQRTPPWVRPRRDVRYGRWSKRLRALVPGLMTAERLQTYVQMESRYPLFFGRFHRVGSLGEHLVRWQLRRELGAELAARSTPSHRLGCKRILASDDWWPMMKRPNVSLETRAIREVDPHGVILADGDHVRLDALVCATGFRVDRPLGDLKVTGRGGVDLAERWGLRPRAWLGLTVPGFPNAFLLLGPNTALGHNSVVVMIEAQIRHLVQAILHVSPVPDGWIDLRPDALDRFVADIDRRHATRVWTTGCKSWYQAEDGSQFALWPGSTLRYLWRTRTFDPAVYEAGTG